MNVVVQFYSWFKFHFSLFLAMVIYDHESKTMGKKFQTKDKTEPKHEFKYFKIDL